MCLIVFIIKCAYIVSANNFAAPFLFAVEIWDLIVVNDRFSFEQCKIVLNIIRDTVEKHFKQDVQHELQLR